jgi:hypothetical protein
MTDRLSPRIVERRLRQLYGQPRHHNERDPLAELVFIVLSTQTREAEYRQTFRAIWKAYRSWERVRRADAGELEALIRFGGFAGRKVRSSRSSSSESGSTTGRRSEARAVIHTAPGEEAQVDYGDGPMVRDPKTGKYRRTRLFVHDARLQPQVLDAARHAAARPRRDRPRRAPRGRTSPRRADRSGSAPVCPRSSTLTPHSRCRSRRSHACPPPQRRRVAVRRRRRCAASCAASSRSR